MWPTASTGSESSRYYQSYQFELNGGASRYAGSLGVCRGVRNTVRYFARTHGRICAPRCATHEPHLTILEIATNGCFYGIPDDMNCCLNIQTRQQNEYSSFGGCSNVSGLGG